MKRAIHISSTVVYGSSDHHPPHETDRLGVLVSLFDRAKEFGTLREDSQSVLDRAGFGKKVVGEPANLALWTLRLLAAMSLSPTGPGDHETGDENSMADSRRGPGRQGVPSVSERFLPGRRKTL